MFPIRRQRAFDPEAHGSAPHRRPDSVPIRGSDPQTGPGLHVCAKRTGRLQREPEARPGVLKNGRQSRPLALRLYRGLSSMARASSSRNGSGLRSSSTGLQILRHKRRSGARPAAWMPASRAKGTSQASRPLECALPISGRRARPPFGRRRTPRRTVGEHIPRSRDARIPTVGHIARGSRAPFTRPVAPAGLGRVVRPTSDGPRHHLPAVGGHVPHSRDVFVPVMWYIARGSGAPFNRPASPPGAATGRPGGRHARIPFYAPCPPRACSKWAWIWAPAS